MLHVGPHRTVRTTACGKCLVDATTLGRCDNSHLVAYGCTKEFTAKLSNVLSLSKAVEMVAGHSLQSTRHCAARTGLLTSGTQHLRAKMNDWTPRCISLSSVSSGALSARYAIVSDHDADAARF